MKHMHKAKIESRGKEGRHLKHRRAVSDTESDATNTSENY
jgi:hypothetical protein